MNVFPENMITASMELAPTLLVLSLVPVYLDSKEMDSIALVSFNILIVVVFQFILLLLDINECQRRNNCSINAGCQNTAGSYSCSCVHGYEGDGINCQGMSIKSNSITVFVN